MAREIPPAPDPTAGEDDTAGMVQAVVRDMPDGSARLAWVHSAASTGTSEDVEARLRHHLRATTGGLGVADLDALLADREAAARAEGAAKALTDAAYDWDDADVFPGEEPDWLRDRAARIAREGR